MVYVLFRVVGVFQSHTDKLNTQVALHQLYQYASKYYDGVRDSSPPITPKGGYSTECTAAHYVIAFFFTSLHS